MKNFIKIERARHNLTQQDLADKVAVSRQTINSIEAGKYIPSTVLALKIAQVFELPVDAVFQLEDSDFE